MILDTLKSIPGWLWIVFAILFSTFAIQKSLAAVGDLIIELPKEFDRIRCHMTPEQYYEAELEDARARIESRKET